MTKLRMQEVRKSFQLVKIEPHLLERVKLLAAPGNASNADVAVLAQAISALHDQVESLQKAMFTLTEFTLDTETVETPK